MSSRIVFQVFDCTNGPFSESLGLFDSLEEAEEFIATLGPDREIGWLERLSVPSCEVVERHVMGDEAVKMTLKSIREQMEIRN